MTRIKIHISNVKLPFYTPCEVKCGLQNRVSTRKFLGFMVSQREIEANPEKVKAILNMTSPKIVKEV